MKEHLSSDTKTRLLDAATLVFAEKGYLESTIQEISTLAHANVAAVNYHFGNKENLYIAAWKSVSRVMREAYLEPMMEIADPEERLKQIVRQRIDQTFDEGPMGLLRKLAFREMSAPTKSHEHLISMFLHPFRDLLVTTVAELLERPEDDPIVQRCEFSLHSQLIFLNVLRMRDKLHQMHFLAGLSKAPSEDERETLSNHITTFVLGGLRAITELKG